MSHSNKMEMILFQWNWVSKVSKTQLLHFDDPNSKRTKNNIMLELIKNVWNLELVSINAYIANLWMKINGQLVHFWRCFQFGVHTPSKSGNWWNQFLVCHV